MSKQTAFVFTGLTLCAASLAQAQNKAPNILFIMADDHATQAIGAYGGFLAHYMPTPNIDRIAKEGARMTDCFVTNSICEPSRACILTGQYSQKNGVYTLDDMIDRNLPTMAKELQKAGYQTAIVGKWHLSSEPAGFDYYNVFPGLGQYDNPLFIRKGDWHNGPNGDPKLTELGGHETDVVANDAISYMQSTNRDKPFFLMCCFKATHSPWDPAARFKDLLKDVTIPEPPNLLDTYEGKGKYAQALRMGLETFKEDYHLKGQHFPPNSTRDEKRHWAYQLFIKDYLRCVAGIDENVGRLLKYLDDNGLADNTIVVYTSDQGFFTGQHGWYDKRLMYEESLRMPLMIRYPREIKAGTVNNDFVMNLDFAPLLLDYAGLATPSYMQGESFRNNLKGQTPADWRTSVYYRYWMNEDDNQNAPAHYGIRTGCYKLIYYYALPLGIKGANKGALKPEWELYDVQKDPAEMHNIYNDPANKDLVAQLKKELLKLKKKYGDEDDKYPEMLEINKQYW